MTDRATLTLKWGTLIQQFYDSFPFFFRTAWKTLQAHLAGDPGDIPASALFGPDPVYWKTIGDEIVFWKELTCESQIWMCIAAWMNAVDDMRGVLKDTPLDIKSVVWSAGFPVRNRAVTKSEDEALVVESGFAESLDATNPNEVHRFIVENFYETERKGKYRSVKTSVADEATSRDKFLTNDYFKGFVDFIGPGIDVGFRLGSLASSKKMIVSIDVAYLMSESADKMESLTNTAQLIGETIGRVSDSTDCVTNIFSGRLDIHYGGTHLLKGVIGGVNYPLFWINTEKSNSLDSEKSNINERWIQPVPWEKVKTFCKEFYRDRRNFIFTPFIYGSEHSISARSHEDKVEYSRKLRQVAVEIDPLWVAENWTA